ncbi:uncharacterized protein LOC144100662 [Amblyomma americanum]
MVVRPLYFEFPADDITQQQTLQFMLGRQLMVIPPTEYRRPEDSTVAWTPVPVYLPAGVWYEWYQGYNITLRRGLFTNATATIQRAVTLFLRGGGVLVTTSPTRGLQLTVSPDAEGFAYGEFLKPPGVIAPLANVAQWRLPGSSVPADWAPDHSNISFADTVDKRQYTHFRFFFEKNFLAGHCSPCALDLNVRVITVLGLTEVPTQVIIDGQEEYFQFTNKTLRLSGGPFVRKRPFFMKIT